MQDTHSFEARIIKKTRFAQVPYWMVKDLEDRELRVYIAIDQYANLPDGARPSIARMAEDVGRSVSYIKRGIEGLVAKRLLIIQQRSKGKQQLPSRYLLAFDEPFPEGAQPERYARNPTGANQHHGGKVSAELTPKLQTELTVSSQQSYEVDTSATHTQVDTVKSGCDCITHAIKHGDFTERLGTPPDIQGLETKAAQRKAVNDYVGTPPKCYSQSERRAWYDYEAQWNYPHGADTKVKARHDVAWAWGVPVEDVDTVDGWWWLLEQAQKAHSGLVQDGYRDFIDPQSQTLVKWHTARMWMDRKNSHDWGFYDYDRYTEDIGFRDADWPPIRQPGSAA